MHFISVDCGTTNLRCRLIDAEGIIPVCETKRVAGGRDTALTGGNARLRAALIDAVSEILSKSPVPREDIATVICSGTITSNVGVYHVHHLACPAGVPESARAAEAVEFGEIPGLPFFFIPGVKTLPGKEVLGRGDAGLLADSYDSMSGEECETYGLLDLLGVRGDAVVCLPGSYTKVFYVSPEGRISSMSSGMGGELMAAVSENTLLRATLPKPVIREIIPRCLESGYDYAETRGVSPALAKSRILNVNCGWSDDETGNFFAGAALSGDVRSVMNECREGKPLIIGGVSPLREVLSTLLAHASGDRKIDVRTAKDSDVLRAVPCGQWKVWQEACAATGSRPKILKTI